MGFETDNCLIKYRDKEMGQVVAETYLNDLCNSFVGYPPNTVIDEKNMPFDEIDINKTLVWDIVNGTVLRLGPGCKVETAVLGYEVLDND